ncbi:MAG: dgoA, partial [Polaromonas sp.]|nr:dgoA [Polaromonas sp.]
TPAAVKALLAVLPDGTALMPVGGITQDNMRPYLAAGACGFGIGSALYRPGMQAGEVADHARGFAAAFAGARQ